ncbi:MAG: T9SS type A sorting domain-containing protein [Sphingobacteriales bacterium JAD_PAG50586_3]|nr:MAG: T9SS type A sorting domain-containing protein [Sphingobacteriales bacterium JAD_PAG50586_3]
MMQLKNIYKLPAWIIAMLVVCFSINAQTGWEKIENGVASKVACFYNDLSDNQLYVGGTFKFANNTPQNFITRINSSFHFDSINTTSITNVVYDIEKYNGNIYVGMATSVYPTLKYFDTINNTWINLSDSMSVDGLTGGPVRALRQYNDKLLVGGGFLKINNDTVFGITYWDGTKFQPFWYYTPQSGVTRFFVTDLMIYHGEVYAGGSFDISPYGNVISLVKFDGTKWVPVGLPYLIGGSVYALQVYNDELYVGGFFKKQQGFAGDFIMKWDGTNWHDVGGGLNQVVKDMIVYNGSLYVSGSFTVAGGTENAENIVRWDGSQWHKIDDSFFDWNHDIECMAVHNEYLYIACGPTINGDTVNWIARRYIGPEETKDIEEIINIYPNPVTDNLTLEYNLDKASNFKFALYDVLGNIIYQEEKPNAYGYYYYTIPTLNLANGLYIARIELNGNTMVKKIIKQ